MILKNLSRRLTVLGFSPARYDTIGDEVYDHFLPDRSLSQYGMKSLSLIAATLVFAWSMNASADTVTNAAGTIASGAALPDTGGSVIRVFGALILVIAIFLGGVWMFRNWQRFAVKKAGGARLNLIEVKSLGQRQAIYVVGYQEQRMLLASSPAGITLLSHLPAAEAEEVVKAAETAPAPGAKMSFAEAFQRVLTKKA